MQFTHDEIVNTLEMKYIAASSIGYTLPPGICEIGDLNLMLKSLLPNEVKVNDPDNEIRLRSDLTTIKPRKLTKNLFFYTVSCFHSITFKSLRRYWRIHPEITEITCNL